MNREEKVKEYYRNCYPSNIEYSNKVRDENGNKNDLYFRELTIQLYNLWNNEVNQNITFSEETKKYLKIENRQLHYLFNDIFKLFHRVCVFEETPTGGVKSINPIFRSEYDIEKCFSNIDFHSLFISTLIENSQYNEAIAVKNYLLTRINTIITNSKQLFGISLLKSPLAGYFTNYISSLKEAINIDEIEYISLKEPQQQKQLIKEEPKQDKSIILTEIHDHHSGKKTCYEYEHVLKRFNEIPKHSKFILFNANNRKYAVYSATISYVFSSKTKGKYNDTDEVFNIDGDPYFKTFTDAYEKGEEDFKADYVNSNLYNSNTEKLVSDIHHAVYHSKFGSYYGWSSVVNFYPNRISHKIIKEYGYYSGMLSSAKEFIKKHPTIFKDVDKCNHSVTKKEPQQEKEYNFENNFDNIKPELVYDYFNKMLVEKKYISKETLQLFLKSAFQEKEKPNQRFKIDNKPTNKKIQDIFYKYYKDIAGKPHGQKRKYVELLGEYFIGFKTNTLMTNFSKTY